MTVRLHHTHLLLPSRCSKPAETIHDTGTEQCTLTFGKIKTSRTCCNEFAKNAVEGILIFGFSHFQFPTFSHLHHYTHQPIHNHFGAGVVLACEMCPSFLVASSSSIGGRQSQEDRIVAVPDLNAHIPEASRSEVDPPRSFFGIFDGHGGHACSEFLAKNFHLELARSALLRSDPKAALLDVWDTLDGEFFEVCAQVAKDRAVGKTAAEGARQAAASFPRDGSTATILLLVGNKLFSGNCGDSAGFLVKKNGKVQALTTNHDTLNQREIERVHRCGGFYREQTLKATRRWPMCCFVQDAVVGKPRVYPGGLLVTRAFGNFSAKVLALGGKPGVILADCDEIVEMTVEDDWAEIVIASDGVWDVLRTEGIPQLLTRLGGKDERSVTLGYSAPKGTTDDLSETERDVEAEKKGNEDTSRLKHAQAQLNRTCARLILSCVRHRYWLDNQAVPDNASAVILRFYSQEPKARGGAKQQQQPSDASSTAVASKPKVQQLQGVNPTP